MEAVNVVHRLHLIANGEEDAEVISALMQDTTVRAADIRYEPRQRRLVLAGERFCWERRIASRSPVGLKICGVMAAARQGWPDDGDALLHLLAIWVEGPEGGGGRGNAGAAAGGKHGSKTAGAATRVTLIFAGGPAIRLTVECVDIMMDDLGDPEPTAKVPCHK